MHPTLQIDFDCDKFTSRWGSFGDPDGIYKKVEMLRVYEMALRTWSDWLEVHVNRKKTHLFFVSMSPTHVRYTHIRIIKVKTTHDCETNFF